MVRSTFAGFTTAQLALQANQRAIDVAGQNLSNEHTRGYTRQRLDLASISPTGASYSNMNGRSRAGQGVIMKGIVQIRDPFVDVQYRNQATLVSESQTKDDFLADMGNIFDQVSKSEMRTDLLNISSALNNMASPDASIESSSPAMVRSSMQVFVDAMHQKALELSQARATTEGLLKDTMIPDINECFRQISELNQTIKNTQALGGGALELVDERNMLIDKLAEFVPIEVEDKTISLGKDIDVSRLSIKLKGVTAKDKNGNDVPVYLIDDVNKHAIFSIKTDQNGNIIKDANCKVAIDLVPAVRIPPEEVIGKDYYGNDDFYLVEGAAQIEYALEDLDGSGPGTVKGIKDVIGVSTPATPPSTDPKTRAAGGELYGMIQILNNRAGEGFNGIGYYEDSMNEIVNQFAITFNNLNMFGTVDGIDLDKAYNGASDKEFVLSQIIEGERVGPEGSEQGLIAKLEDPLKTKIINEFNNQVTFEKKEKFVKEKLPKMLVKEFGLFSKIEGAGEDPTNDGFTAENIRISEEWLNDAGILNRTVKDPEEHSSDYGNILQMVNVITSHKNSYIDKDYNVLLGNGTFIEAFDELQNNQAISRRAEKGILENRMAVQKQVSNTKESISGVSNDEEVINMMRFQKSYAATARFMTTLDEMMDKLINGTGVVGR